MTLTHCERILQVLQDGEAHGHLELYGLGTVAHSRIADLRAKGFEIEQWRDGDTYYYRLVAEGGRSSPLPAPASGNQPWAAGPSEANSGLGEPRGLDVSRISAAEPSAAPQLFETPPTRPREAWA